MTAETTSDASRVQSVYQPIVDLSDESVVGYEALARTSPEYDVAPDFEDHAGLREVEWASRTAALSGALDARLDRNSLLFVNVEPRVLDRAAPEAFARVFDRALQDLQLVIELTERDLLHSPRELFRFADRIRGMGLGLALDDVGVHTASLAALPFLDPDVVKLDISLVQNDPTGDQARTLTGLLAHSERMGTTLLAEGIETEAHLERARTLGAAFGQGYLFGRPGPLPLVRPTGSVRLPLPGAGRHRASIGGVPGTLLESTTTRTARKPVLEKLSRQLEQQACNQADPSVLLATFQEAQRLGPAGERFAQLAAVCQFVGVLGADMPAEPMPGVRGAALPPGDPLLKEWTVVVVGAHYAGALIAREIDDGPVEESERRFAFVLTHDRDTVVAAGRHLLCRFGESSA